MINQLSDLDIIFLLCVFQSRALNSVCEKTVQTTSDPLKRDMACLEEVHITNIKPGQGLVSSENKIKQQKQKGQNTNSGQTSSFTFGLYQRGFAVR